MIRVFVMVSELWCGTYVASLFGHILQVLDWFGIWGVWMLGQCNGLSDVFPEVLLSSFCCVVWCIILLGKCGNIRKKFV